MVLDDIWTPEHERLLNFVDAAISPRIRVLVTTRFAKLLPGYFEVALGLLSEVEAIELLLGTAETKVEPLSPRFESVSMLPAALSLYIKMAHIFGSIHVLSSRELILLGNFSIGPRQLHHARVGQLTKLLTPRWSRSDVLCDPIAAG